jgi:hypothetical protein
MEIVVALAQSVEHRIVAPKVAGSSPVGHPTSLVNNRHACFADFASLIPVKNVLGYVHWASETA